MPSWGNTKVPNNSRSPKLTDLVELVDLGPEYLQVRPVGPVTQYAEHWIEIWKRDNGKAKINKICLNFDPTTGDFNESGGCPYCAAGVRADRKYLGNVIVRELAATEPRNPPQTRPAEQQARLLGPEGDPESIQVLFKMKESRSWTPVRVLRASTSLASTLQALTKINKHGGEPKQLSDVRFGRDVMVLYNKDAAGSAKYQATFGNDGPGPLSKEERRYLMWPIFGLLKPEEQSAAEQEWERLAPKYIPPKSDKDASDAAGDDAGYYGASGDDVPVQPARRPPQSRRPAQEDPPWDAGSDDLEETAQVPARRPAQQPNLPRTSSSPPGTAVARPPQARRPLPTVGQVYNTASGKVKVLAISTDRTRAKVMRPNRSEVVIPITDIAA